MATLAELIAEDAVWHLGGRNSLTGDYEGREAIFGLFARLGQESEGTMRIDLHDVVANDDHVVVLTSVSAGGSRGNFASNTCDTSHMRDGQITEFWSFAEDPYAWDEYWA
jgi:ketosteroid isomerase-like protein